MFFLYGVPVTQKANLYSIFNDSWFHFAGMEFALLEWLAGFAGGGVRRWRGLPVTGFAGTGGGVAGDGRAIRSGW